MKAHRFALHAPALLLMATLASIVPAKVAGQPAWLSAPIPLCGSSKRISCVVDGDTFWLRGEKIRIADIDTPEVSRPGCPEERALGDKATLRLQKLLNAGPFNLTRTGRDRDRFGRLLRIVQRDGKSLGGQLVREGLARRWDGKRRGWCGV